MASMTHPRASSLVSVVLVGASLALAPIEVHAGPGPNEVARPVEGPARPPAPTPETPAETPPGEPSAVEPELTPAVIPPPPSFDPNDVPGIEFVVPPPVSDENQHVAPHESPLAATWPDPGIAPNDGAAMLVMGGTTAALTLLGFSAALTIGLARDTPLEQLLPATIVPAAGLLAVSAGGLYLGIKRAVAHHRWEAAYRVVGEPQGAGLNVGATFMLLGALFLIPAGAFALDPYNSGPGASMIAVGSAAAVATPIMYTVAAHRKRNYERTGGWHRRPIPQIPGEDESRLHISPLVAPTFGGVTVGARGQF
jgi:hypothetical protein